MQWTIGTDWQRCPSTLNGHSTDTHAQIRSRLRITLCFHYRHFHDTLAHFLLLLHHLLMLRCVAKPQNEYTNLSDRSSDGANKPDVATALRKYHVIRAVRGYPDIQNFHVIHKNRDMKISGVQRSSRNSKILWYPWNSGVSGHLEFSWYPGKTRHIEILECTFVVSCDICSIIHCHIRSIITATLKIIEIPTWKFIELPM